MKKFLLVLLVPLVVSAAAIAAPNPASVTAHCNNLLRTAPGLFTGQPYANLAACVTAKTVQAAQNSSNAAQTCKAARDGDTTAFATAHTGKSFAEVYGKNANDKNALGKCVSATASATAVAQQTAELKAAKQCKLWRSSPSAFAAAHLTAPTSTFASLYGTKKNALGKCVSTNAKAQQHS